MARFDVYAGPEADIYLLDCQSDLLSGLNTRLVVPLLPLAAAPRPAARLNPVFEIAGVPHVMATQFMAAVPASLCRERVASLQDEALTIGNAIDMLLSGF